MNMLVQILMWSLFALAVIAKFYWLFQEHLSAPQNKSFRKNVRAACLRYANQNFAIFDPENELTVEALQQIADRFVEEAAYRLEAGDSSFADWLAKPQSKESMRLPSWSGTMKAMIARVEIIQSHNHPDWHQEWIAVFGMGRKHRLKSQLPWNSKEAQQLYSGKLQAV